MASELIFFYIPIPNETVGEDLAKKLIEKNLIACANILPPHKSVYKWEGKVQTETENIMILKSLKSLAKNVETFLKENHPYDTPCITQIDVENCNSDFSEWVKKQTS